MALALISSGPRCVGGTAHVRFALFRRGRDDAFEISHSCGAQTGHPPGTWLLSPSHSRWRETGRLSRLASS